MKKRTFLKTSGVLMAGSSLLPVVAAADDQQDVPRKNWAGNLTYSASGLTKPSRYADLQRVVREQAHVKVLGSRHSFNSIADTVHQHLSLENIDGVIQVNEHDLSVRVHGAVKYGVLASVLDQKGFALHNLASLPHISVAGACATATHGSGDNNGNLASAVTGLELLSADGGRVSVSMDSDRRLFEGMVVHLGALGIVEYLILRIEPTFQVCQFVYEELPLRSLGDHFEEIFSSAYSVSLFTDWQGQRINQVWQKVRIRNMQIPRVAEEYFGAKLASGHLHPIREISPVNCTEQMGLPGPWHERLPHFKMGFTPSSGEELQSEYFIPRKHAVEAIHAMYGMGEEIYPYLLISEIRSIASDALWMSPAYQQDVIALHFTWKPDWPNVQKILPKIENRLKPFGVRPHWGKLFTLQPSEILAQYERMDDFRNLVKNLDPKGKFRNEFLSKYLGAQ
jgi:xylitol oxidase